MVNQHYRWDFIGLSTDQKPTPATSEKVVDGSTFYCSDTSKLYVFCKDTWYEKTVSGGGGGTSNFNNLTNRPKYNGTEMTGTTDIPEVKTYTAGTNVSISAAGEISATDTTYSDFTGTDGTAAGVAGLVPAPTTSDTDKYLKSDGSWATVSGGGPTVVQTTGTSTTDVMSQNAVTSMVFGSSTSRVKIGNSASSNANNTIAIGDSARASVGEAMALGQSAVASHTGSVALGANSHTSVTGEIAIGVSYTVYGYNNSNYRIISGVYDGQSAHDAATKGQLDSIAIQNAGAPTTSTVGTVGQLLEDTTNGKLYICTAIVPGTAPDPDTYTWEEVGAGGSGPTVVQTTGTSTTDVMSQNAVTGMVFADPATKYRVRIGANTTANADDTITIGANAYTGYHSSTAIGNYASTYGANNVAIGRETQCSGTSNICLGAWAKTSSSDTGVMQIGSNRTGYETLGYNNSQYRLLSGVYDPQSAHDAATKGYVDGLATMGTLSTTPTGTTVGTPGRLYTYDSGGGTYEVYLCVHDNGDDTYIWKQVSLT